MREWIEPPDVAVPEALRAAVGGHPLVATTLARRGLTDVAAALAFLDPDRYTPTPASALPGMALATDRLARAIADREPICVWGDFDVDGQTSTALLIEILGDLGARVTYHVPVRETESHGVNLPGLQRALAAGARVLLTCDTGIAAHQAVAYARAEGVDVIITDHHELPPVLPDAYAIVNPKLLPTSHPLRDLPGVGCAYKLAEGLCERLQPAGPAAQQLDLVALGIVADLAEQRGDTRYLLQRGLAALRDTRRLGLQVLMETADLDPGWITEEHVAYVLAPRLNAVGRLADASAAVELLTTTDLARARVLASQLEGLNARRKLLCDQVYAGVQAQIGRDPGLLHDSALVLANASWPAGVIGIVASRLVERYGRPTVLIATPPGQIGRGSARSVEGCDITAAIAGHADLLEGFGGHPMAAGFSIDAARVPEFRRALARTVSAMSPPPGPAAPGGQAFAGSPLAIDALVQPADLSLELVEDLGRLAPFGPGNPLLTLMGKNLAVKAQRTVGRNGEHRLLTVVDAEGTPSSPGQQVIWWDAGEDLPPEGTMDLAYTVRASDYRGQRQMQIVWLDARPGGNAPIAVEPEIPTVEVIDYRGVAGPRERLAQVAADGQVAVWREGEAATQIQGQDRYNLSRSERLAIWTAPPGPAELREVLGRVRPMRVYLFGVDPGSGQPNAFLRRLAGLVKYALRTQEGRTTVSSLASATAQREATVRQGLAWLAARGDIGVVNQQEDALTLVAGNGPQDATSPAPADEAGARLSALLAETAAYRAYFRQAPPDALMRSQG
jgi:single-stranded-DNA-specific exonuclease